MKVYYRGYLIESNFIKKFNCNMVWIYAYSDNNWYPVSNSRKSLKEAKAYIKEHLR